MPETNTQLADFESIQTLMKSVIEGAWVVREFAKNNNLLNSQEYLEFEDTLNRISTMDPNA